MGPFRSMILSQLERNSSQSLALFWGVRSERDLYFQDKFQDLTDQYPHFSFVTTLSQAGPAWTGARDQLISASGQFHRWKRISHIGDFADNQLRPCDCETT
jgi:Na+-transporting NADH:ubiquinone oxidoreductase subunit NqrF